MNAKSLLVILFVLVLAFGAWQVIPAVKTYEQTGVLDVSASSPNASISISQENHQATIIGTGSAKVRLKPGTYYVVAADSGLRGSATVTVNEKQTTNTDINVSKSINNGPTVRTINNVSFQDTDELLNSGISTTQLDELEQYFFQFKPSVNTVNIVSGSAQPGPRNPNIISPFTLNFDVVFDNKPYTATASYSDTKNISLKIFDPQTNAVVFNSEAKPKS